MCHTETGTGFILLSCGSLYTRVTESQLIPLTARQANKLTHELLGQGIATLFGKPADQEDGGLVSQRTIFPDLEFKTLLY